MIIALFPTARHKQKTVVAAPTINMNGDGLGDGWYTVTPASVDSSTHKIKELKEKGPQITYADDESKADIIVTNATRNTIGKSTMVLALSDPKTMAWSDTNSSGNKEYPYELHKLSFIKPTITGTSSWVYDGAAKTFDASLYNTDSSHPISIGDMLNSEIVVTTTKSANWDDKVNAGTRIYSFHLNDYNHDYIEWSDGTYDDVVLTWQISKAESAMKINGVNASTYSQKINIVSTDEPAEYAITGVSSKPTVSTTGGATASVSTNGYYTNNHKYTGDYYVVVSGSSNGDVSITITDSGDENHNGYSKSISGTVKLPEKTVVQAPTVSVGTYTYDGGSHGPSISYTNNQFTVTNRSAINANTYTMVLSLADKDKMIWSDTRNADDKKYSYTINRRSVPVPSLSSTSFTYDGNPHAPTVNNSSSYVSISGNSARVNADTYSVTASLKDTSNTYWASDGSTTSKRIGSFTIYKASSNLRVNGVTSATFERTQFGSGYTQTFYITGAIGTVSMSRSTSNYIWQVHLSQDGTYVTMENLKDEGAAIGTVPDITVTITDQGDSNHYAGTVTITGEGD